MGKKILFYMICFSFFLYELQVLLRNWVKTKITYIHMLTFNALNHNQIIKINQNIQTSTSVKATKIKSFYLIWKKMREFDMYVSFFVSSRYIFAGLTQFHQAIAFYRISNAQHSANTHTHSRTIRTKPKPSKIIPLCKRRQQSANLMYSRSLMWSRRWTQMRHVPAAPGRTTFDIARTAQR